MVPIFTKMPSFHVVRNPKLAVTVEKSFKISVNKQMISIDCDNDHRIYPASKITRISKSIIRSTDDGGRPHDNSSIWLEVNGTTIPVPIKTGPYTEDVYKFIMKHMFDYESDDEDELPSRSTRQTNWGSGVLGH
jgi:hypothetical protein